jgi:hypothetical protein
MIRDHGAAIVGKLRESRINGPVEYVGLEYFDHFAARVYANGASECGKEVVDKQRKAGYVVQVCMCQQYITNLLPMQVGAGEREASGVNSYTVVNDKTREVLAGAGPAVVVSSAS